jgi:hypothetical protein
MTLNKDVNMFRIGQIRSLFVALVATFALSACSTTTELSHNDEAINHTQLEQIDGIHGVTASVDPNKCHYRRC